MLLLLMVLSCSGLGDNKFTVRHEASMRWKAAPTVLVWLPMWCGIRHPDPEIAARCRMVLTHHEGRVYMAIIAAGYTEFGDRDTEADDYWSWDQEMGYDYLYKPGCDRIPKPCLK